MTFAREAWIGRLEACLPPRADVLARNAAITATYARWYLRAPDLFKWSGMAVFASYEAGRYLGRLLAEGGALTRVLPAELLQRQADVIRGTNNGVFDDAGWAHAAYFDPDGGLSAVEEALADSPQHALLVSGFRQIDRGSRLLARDPARAAELVWEGNRALLEHEQRRTVQPFFARFHPVFAGFLSAVARSDFRLGDERVEQRHFPAFGAFMLRHGRAELGSSGARLPDISRFDHRWRWIAGEVLPCWREIESSRQPALLAKMRALAARWPGPPLRERSAPPSADAQRSPSSAATPASPRRRLASEASGPDHAALDRAIARAAAHVRGRQRHDGSWDEPCDAGPATTAQALVALAELGRLDADLRRRALAFLARAQAGDGGFEGYPGAGVSDLGATASVLAATATLDDGAYGPMRRRAEAWIDAHGGFDALVRALGKGELAAMFLAVAGVLAPDRLPSLPSAWLRSPELRRSAQRLAHPGAQLMLGEISLVRRWLLSGRDASRGRRARRGEAALADAVIALHDETQNPSGAFFNNVPQTAAAVLGLRAAGVATSDPRLLRAGEWLVSQVEAGAGDTAFFPAFRSSVWTTALSLRALLRAGEPAGEATAVRAVEWLVAVETEQPKAWDLHPGSRLTHRGGFAFQGDNTRMPDCDDTAVVLDALGVAMAAPEMPAALRRRAGARSAHALAWLLDMQNADGGWAAFLHGMRSKPPGPIMTEPLDLWPERLSDLARLARTPRWALGDPATEDVTGRTLRALASCGLDAEEPCVRRAVDFLEAQQCESGAFWGRWSTNYLWTTAHVVLGLRAVGADLAAPALRRAIRFILERQNADGGFGETERSYRDPSLAGRGPSMPPVTALCLEALAAAGEADGEAAARAAGYLLATQQDDGAWPQHGHLQVIIPPDLFYSYPGAARFQPLEALAAYRAALRR